MGILVLVILQHARQHLTVHQNETEALEALAAHVSRNWRSVMKGALSPKSATERIDLFFRATDQDYFIAEIDVDPFDPRQGDSLTLGT